MLVYSDFGFFFGRVVAVVDDRPCHPTEDGFYHGEKLSPGGIGWRGKVSKG
jgi:hypothetical protein